LRSLGHNSARYIHVVSEALKLAFADRERYYGDSPSVPLAALLSPEYLRRRASLIRMDRAMPEAPSAGTLGASGASPLWGSVAEDRSGRAPLGDGWSEDRRRQTPTGVTPPTHADGTTHIAAIDRDGNMIALTPSGGVFRKSAFAPELGCTLSTRSEMFVLEDGHPNGLVPGKRPRTTLVN